MNKHIVFAIATIISTFSFGGYCHRHSPSDHTNCMDCVRCFGLEKQSNHQQLEKVLPNDEATILAELITSNDTCVSKSRVEECNEIAKDVYNIPYNKWIEQDGNNKEASTEMVKLYLQQKAYEHYSSKNELPSTQEIINSWYITESKKH